MKLNHIGLNIQKEEEIADFYQNILGFHLEHQFDMNLNFSIDIFGVNKQSEAFLCRKENVLLELFIHLGNTTLGYSHICLDVKNRESIVGKCKESGYPVIRIERSDKHDLLFIKDKTGNIFELKNEVNENIS
jgi:catechol 2,3-dioxygenase-like lactoylglutathione lyase family enzyme